MGKQTRRTKKLHAAPGSIDGLSVPVAALP